MKSLFILFSLSFTCLSAQRITNFNTNTSKEKQYVYHIKLISIQNVSYPNQNIQLRLLPRTAIMNNDNIISSSDNSLSQVCPNILYGYTTSAAGISKNCETKEKPTLIFREKSNLSDVYKLKIPVNLLDENTRIIFGIYGAELILPNGSSKKIDKANIRSFHLSDFNHSVRNYVKYEFQIQGATIILDYLIERGTKN